MIYKFLLKKNYETIFYRVQTVNEKQSRNMLKHMQTVNEKQPEDGGNTFHTFRKLEGKEIKWKNHVYLSKSL